MIAKYPLNHSRAICLSMRKGEKAVLGQMWAILEPFYLWLYICPFRH